MMLEGQDVESRPNLHPRWRNDAASAVGYLGLCDELSSPVCIQRIAGKIADINKCMAEVPSWPSHHWPKSNECQESRNR